MAETLSMFRAASNKPSAPPSPGVERRDYIIDGEQAVAIRVHRPVGAEGALPCVYSMHGGGYVFGSYAMDDARLEEWSRSYHCVGVSVEYRLAPETPFPGPLDDCYLGLKWVFDHHDELGKPEVPAYAATARAADLRGLPAAYICAGNVDGFRDEAIDYAARLNQASVPAELHVSAGSRFWCYSPAVR